MNAALSSKLARAFGEEENHAWSLKVHRSASIAALLITLVLAFSFNGITSVMVTDKDGREAVLKALATLAEQFSTCAFGDNAIEAEKAIFNPATDEPN